MRPEIFKALATLSDIAKTLDSRHVFCTASGAQYKTTRVSANFRTVWKKTGFLQKYDAFNATLNRKRIATLAHRYAPTKSAETAKQLCHSVATKRLYYNLAHGSAQAATTVDAFRFYGEKRASELRESEPRPSTSTVGDWVAAIPTMSMSSSTRTRWSASEVEALDELFAIEIAESARDQKKISFPLIRATIQDTQFQGYSVHRIRDKLWNMSKKSNKKE